MTTNDPLADVALDCLREHTAPAWTWQSSRKMLGVPMISGKTVVGEKEYTLTVTIPTSTLWVVGDITPVLRNWLIAELAARFQEAGFDRYGNPLEIVEGDA